MGLTPPTEHIEYTIAPPDMWNRQKDSGKSMAELFAQSGIGLLRASNNRVQGWMATKEMLKPMKNEKDKPGLLITSECKGLIRNILATCLPIISLIIKVIMGMIAVSDKQTNP